MNIPMRFLIKSGLLIGACFYLFFLFLNSTQAASCHQYDSSTAVPSGFGAAYDVLSPLKQVTLKTDCSGNTVTSAIGNGNQYQYIYEKGYVWKNSVWQPIIFSAVSKAIRPWIVGNAQITLSSSNLDIGKDNYILAYLCDWDGTSWKCGCADKVCTTNFWQLQKFHVEGCADTDTDGYDDCARGETGDDGNDKDCDNNDSETKPGASEICDGLDNNCDSNIDELCDQDKDGFCTNTRKFFNSPLDICPKTDLPDDSFGNDCNDSDDTVNPNATELCDSINNDCDTEIDEGAKCCADGDDDDYDNCDFQEFGDDSRNLDCDDTNPDIRPAIAEDCATAYDDNCNEDINEGCAECDNTICETGEDCSNCSFDCGGCPELRSFTARNRAISDPVEFNWTVHDDEGVMRIELWRASQGANCTSYDDVNCRWYEFDRITLNSETDTNSDQYRPLNDIPPTENSYYYGVHLADTDNNIAYEARPLEILYAIPICTSNAQCDNNNPCTTDTCVNPGQANATCTRTNAANGADSCGSGCERCWAPNSNTASVCSAWSSACDDFKECTINTCANDFCTLDYVSADTPCATGNCDGSGQCAGTGCSDEDDDGHNTCTGDCNDKDNTVFETQTCNYDGNNCGSYEQCLATCPIPPTEICGNSIDDNCNGQRDETCDLEDPEVLNFSINNTVIEANNSINIAWEVSDDMALDQVELWRVPTNDPTGWNNVSYRNPIHTIVLSTRPNSASSDDYGEFTDTPLDDSLYGLHVRDRFEKIGVEPYPPGPIEVTVNFTGDELPPIVDDFTVELVPTPLLPPIGLGSVRIEWDAHDYSSGIIQSVQTRRAPEVTGQCDTNTEANCQWEIIDLYDEPGRIISYIYFDSPDNGTYLYSVLAYDGAGNSARELDPPGPLRVVVNLDHTHPQIISFSVTPLFIDWVGGYVTAVFEARDDRNLTTIDLERAVDNGSGAPDDGQWYRVNTTDASGKDPVSSEMINTTPEGIYWYRLRVEDEYANETFSTDQFMVIKNSNSNIVCTDIDGDRHIKENIPTFGACGWVCGPIHNQACEGYKDCNDNNEYINLFAYEICSNFDPAGDAIDDNCQDGANEAGCTPVITSLMTIENPISSGEDVIIYYTLDNSRIPLTQAELWRASESSGYSDWQMVVSTSDIGQTSLTDSETLTAGNYRYGIHVVDKNSNWATEGDLEMVDVTVASACVENCPGNIGCLTQSNAPTNGYEVTIGDCCNNETCFACNAGYSWDGTQCILNVVCTDEDGDWHILENNSNYNECDGQCGNSQTCQGYNDCDDNNQYIYYNSTEICSNFDSNDDPVDDNCRDGANEGGCSQVITSLSAARITVNEGEDITIIYSLNSSIIPLIKIELWRASEASGYSDWAPVVSTNNTAQTSLTDTNTLAVDNYRYGIHVDDEKGNWITEGALALVDVTVVPACVCSDNTCEAPGDTGRICDGCDYISVPSESCYNSIDDNCNGQTDENCASGNKYYIRASAQGANNGSSWSNAWGITSINWDQVYNELSNDNVYLYFKRGDTFGRLDIFNRACTIYPHNGPNRLYLGVDPSDSGNKPKFTRHLTGWGYLIGWCNAGYITIDNFDIEDTGQYRTSVGIYTGDDGPCTGGPTRTQNLATKGNIHITNNDLKGFGHYAITLTNAGSHVVVSGNTIRESGNAIYFIDECDNGPEYFYVADNYCEDITGYVQSSGNVVDGHCIGPQSGSHSITENNTSINSRAPFTLWVGTANADQDDNVFRNNVSITNVLNTSIYDGSAGKNVSRRNRHYQNVFYDGTYYDGATKRALFKHDYLHPGDRNNGSRFFNNTVAGAIYHGIGVTNGTDYSLFKNNIIEGTQAGYYFIEMPGSPGSNNEFDYNLYSTDRANAWQYRDNSTGNFSWWQGKSSLNDPNSPTPADPRLVNPGGSDFTLQSTSPAINRGGYLSYVNYSGTGNRSNQTTITVGDAYWFHDNYGLKKANGSDVDGMLISFYDQSNGIQNTEVVDVNYSAGTITVSPAVNYIYNNSNQGNPANNTQVSLRFSGSAPDIGAYEYSGSVPGDTTAPEVDSFSVTAGSAIIDWTVSDSGGSSLDRIEVWRNPDKNGEAKWGEIDSLRQNVSGLSTNSHTGQAIDNPAIDGQYLYGIHVVDKAGYCITQENKDCTTGVSNGLTAHLPEQILIDDTNPSVNNFSAVYNEGSGVTITFSAQDTYNLEQAELWRAVDVDGAAGDWDNQTPSNPLEVKPVSGKNANDLNFTDTPEPGIYWYGLHVKDEAGNWADEGGAVRVEVNSNDVISVKLNEVELKDLEAMPISALNIDGSNEVCIETRDTGRFHLIIALHIEGITYREKNTYIGTGNNLCKDFTIPAENKPGIAILFRAPYNFQIVKGQYTVPSYIYGEPEIVFGLNFDDPSYDLSKSTLNLPHIEDYKGVEIYSNADNFEVNTVKGVLDIYPTPAQTRSVYIYDTEAIYDNSGAKPLSNNMALVSQRSIGIQGQGATMQGNGILYAHQTSIYHELAHTRTYWELNECAGSDCTILSLDPGADSRFESPAQSAKYDFSKLAGGYPSWYSMTNSTEYISNLAEFIYEVYLFGDQINVEHLSPHMKTNIDLLNNRGYLRPELYAAVNAPEGVLPAASRYRIFSSDFPLDNFKNPPAELFPDIIKIDDRIVYNQGSQLINLLPYSESFKICVNKNTTGSTNQFYNTDFYTMVKDGTVLLTKRDEFTELIPGEWCKTITKHPATQATKELIFTATNKITDDKQKYGIGDGLRGEEKRVTINLSQICFDMDKDGYDTCALGGVEDDGKIKDCEDNNETINSGAAEDCFNDIDDNCDGETDENCMSPDTQAPTVNSFTPRPRNNNAPVTFDWEVSDNIELEQVELWRADYVINDCDERNVNVDINNCTWSQVGNSQPVSGLAADSGTAPNTPFTDTPAPDTYWYGLHVKDEAGNWADEGGPQWVDTRTIELNSAEYIRQTVPGTVNAGQEYFVSVTMKNSGNTDWTKSEMYVLGSQNPQDNQNWGLGRVELEDGEVIKPGQAKTFDFKIKAPINAETVNFQWRMLQEGVEWFGDTSDNAGVSVNLTMHCNASDWQGVLYYPGLWYQPTGVYNPDSRFICAGGEGFLRCGGDGDPNEGIWNTWSRKVIDYMAGDYFCDGQSWKLNSRNYLNWKSNYYSNGLGGYGIPLNWAYIKSDSKIVKISGSNQGLSSGVSDICIIIHHPQGVPWTITGTNEIICNTVDNSEQEPWIWNINSDIYLPKDTWLTCHTTLWSGTAPPASSEFECRIDIENYSIQTVTKTLRFPPVDQFAPEISPGVLKNPTIKYKSQDNFPITVNSFGVFTSFIDTREADACIYWLDSSGGVKQTKCIPNRNRSVDTYEYADVTYLSPKWVIPPGEYLASDCGFSGGQAGAKADCAVYAYVEVPEGKRDWQHMFLGYLVPDNHRQYCEENEKYFTSQQELTAQARIDNCLKDYDMFSPKCYNSNCSDLGHSDCVQNWWCGNAGTPGLRQNTWDCTDHGDYRFICGEDGNFYRCTNNDNSSWNAFSALAPNGFEVGSYYCDENAGSWVIDTGNNTATVPTVLLPTKSGELFVPGETVAFQIELDQDVSEVNGYFTMSGSNYVMNLQDDGLHNDKLANDNIWGFPTNSFVIDNYSIDIHIIDTDNQVHEFPGLISFSVQAAGAVPTAFDWRDHNGGNWLTSVKNQSTCNSCYAFVIAGTVEAKHNIQENDPDLDVDLSEQYLVSDCCGANSGCGGGNTNSYACGLVDEACAPYQNTDSSCADICSDWGSRYWDTSYGGYLSPGAVDNNTLKYLIMTHGPMYGNMSVNNFVEHPGYEYTCNGSDYTHGMVLVGWDDIKGYWIAKNSWGVDWGDNGYAYIRYNSCDLRGKYVLRGVKAPE